MRPPSIKNKNYYEYTDDELIRIWQEACRDFKEPHSFENIEYRIINLVENLRFCRERIAQLEATIQIDSFSDDFDRDIIKANIAGNVAPAIFQSNYESESDDLIEGVASDAVLLAESILKRCGL